MRPLNLTSYTAMESGRAETVDFTVEAVLDDEVYRDIELGSENTNKSMQLP